MNLNLKGKTALITGSTSGIGFTTAKILLKEGLTVYINGRTKGSVENALVNLKDEVVGARVFGLIADFSKSNQVKNLLEKLEEIDILVNNVGIYSSKSFFETSIETWQEQLEVNLMSCVSLSKHYLKGMLERNWGRVLFISSECAYLVPSDMISYSATKAAMHAVSRGIANVTKGTDVTSNVVVPGSTLTEGAKAFLTEKANAKNTSIYDVEKDFFNNDRPSSLLKRFTSTDEVASTITYLCSPLSSATNGAVIKVDGGSSGGIL
tara:strand:+ start:28427 stop:29221 length:795 start_codon:yes stop_codon:yes gene_type:complete